MAPKEYVENVESDILRRVFITFQKRTCKSNVFLNIGSVFQR